MPDEQTQAQPAAAPPQRTIRLELANKNSAFRDRSGVHLVGDQVVELPEDKIPPLVAHAINSGRLRRTTREPQENTRGPIRPTSTLPKLVPHARSRQHAIIPNFDVSTTYTGGTTEDAGNHGPSGMNSMMGRHKAGDPPSEAAVLVNREVMHQQYGAILTVEQAEELLAQAADREARLTAELAAVRAAMEGDREGARAIQAAGNPPTPTREEAEALAAHQREEAEQKAQEKAEKEQQITAEASAEAEASETGTSGSPRKTSKGTAPKDGSGEQP